MKYSQMKRFLMEHKDSMKPPYISTLDGILTAGGELIGYQELEMDSPYLDVHEDTSYTKDYVTLHSHEFTNFFSAAVETCNISLETPVTRSAKMISSSFPPAPATALYF